MAPLSFGTWVMVQVVPFQCSANATCVVPPYDAPTATQFVADVQATSFRTLLVAPAGFGVAVTAHVLPFHFSARVTSLPEEFLSSPTAMQPPAVQHETPISVSPVEPAGLGVVLIDQPPAVRASARVDSALDL